MLADTTWAAGFTWAAGDDPAPDPDPEPEPEPATFVVVLEPTAVDSGRTWWTAVVTVSVASSDGAVAGVTVSGDWGASARGTGSCTTDDQGTCVVTKRVRGQEATFTVTGAVGGGLLWDGEPPVTSVSAP